MFGSAGWAYVDDRRTHEVRVAFDRGRTLDLVVREAAFGGAPAGEVYTERHTLTDPWDVKLHTLALETRLALLGNYYRSAQAGWTPVRLAQAGPKLDLRPLDMEGAGAIEFHHFRGEDRRAVSLVCVHQGTDRGRRSLLARLDYDFPDTDGGRLRVVHSRLTPILYRSALASLHLELAEQRYAKVPPDHKNIGDARAWAALRAALDGILARLVESADAKADVLLDAAGKPLDARSLILVSEASRAIKGAASRERKYEVEFEVDAAAANAAGKKPDVVIDELPADVFTALREPRLLALHDRFMSPAAEAQLFSRGERAIGSTMRELRGKVRPDEQHLVSLLEASLLLRYALKNRIPVDPNVIKRVQYARAYL